MARIELQTAKFALDFVCDLCFCDEGQVFIYAPRYISCI
jgi:hypothetical protein